MEDVILYTIMGCFGVWIGWHIRGIILLARFSENPEHYISILQKIKRVNEEEKKEKSESTGTELAIERHGDMLYAFAKDTDQFIAQGSTLDSLLDDVKKRFPDRKFFGVIDKDSPAKELV